MEMIRLAETRACATGAAARRTGAKATIEGMLASTLVLTLEGAFPVEYLSIGDRIVSRSGASRLTGIEITVVQNARVVRIAPDTPGIDMPRDEITLAAAQPIVLRGGRSTALPGLDQTLVPASRLANGCTLKAETLGEARLFKLTFAEPTMIYAGGLLLACDETPVSA